MLKLPALAIGPLMFLLLALSGATAAVAAEGYATWYGEPYQGRRMANGQVFDMHDPTTTASNEFPFGTWLRVTNPRNGNVVEVQVRDRGGFSHALDLSYAAFAKLAPPGSSRILVRYEVIPGPGQQAVPAPAASPKPAPPAVPVVLPTAVSAPLANPGSYTIQPGDTLAAIARRYGLSTADIAAWSGLANPNLLPVGQMLRLIAPPPPPPTPSASLPVGGSVYVVQDGDVLWQIAERLQVSADELAVANNLGGDQILLPGQQLHVPSSAVYYEVQRGDTLWAIADHFETSVEALLSLNGLDDPNHVLAGQQLQVR